MDLTNPQHIKSLLSAYGFRAKKSLGQHFLIDEAALEGIVDAANLSLNDNVLEIGPGLGVLTERLVKKAGKVLAVEFDEKMIEVLKNTVPSPNLQIENEHVLKFNLSKLPKNYKVVANLPYYITSPIIRNFLETKSKPQVMVLLIQKEVAQRIVAKPGNLSVLGVAVQFYGKPEIMGIVPKASFWPPPKVDSAIIKIEVYDEPLFRVDNKKFFRIVKAGFGEKRKQLVNSLSGGLQLPKEDIITYLNLAKLKASARAEELSLEDWNNLYQVIKEKII
jgi:16S rRNA (adenine1518-N6/adenine1519-N6)-dimethyltransferase